MSNHQKGFVQILLLIGIVVVVVVAGGGIYWTQKINKEPSTDRAVLHLKQLSDTEKIIDPKSSANPNQDETANWKTYTSLYGYTINYPQDAELLDCEGHCNFEAQIKKPELLITLGTFGLPLNRKLSDYLYYGFCLPKGNTNEEKINNSVFHRSEKNYSADNICLDAVVDLNKKKNDSYLILDIQAKAYTQDGVKLFNQILSTFRFD